MNDDAPKNRRYSVRIEVESEDAAYALCRRLESSVVRGKQLTTLDASILSSLLVKAKGVTITSSPGKQTHSRHTTPSPP
jgi:hypothetical protein